MFKYKLENLDVNEDFAKVYNVRVNKNDYIEQGDLICTIETTKVTQDIYSEKSGYIEILFNEGENIKFGDILYIIKEDKNEIFENKNFNKKNNNIQNSNITLTKKAKKYLKNNNLSLENIMKKLDSTKPIIKLNDIKEINKNRKNDNRNNIDIIYNRKKIVIIGAGSTGEVVADILMDYKEYEIVGFVDDNPRDNFNFYGKEIIYDNVRNFPVEFEKSLYDAVIISFSMDLDTRKEIFDLYQKNNIEFINAIDKTAEIGRNVKLGIGNVIGAHTYIGTSSEINNNNWIASSVNIDHHNDIGSHNLFGPNFASPGMVKIKNLNKFGANSSLNVNVKIGSNNVIKNNASIYKNIENDCNID